MSFFSSLLTSVLARLSRLTPAQGLMILSPALAELVSHHQPIWEFFNPLFFLITLFPYGCGALLVRELVVRNRKGWFSVMLLGIAFGLFFEGIVTRVLFNSNWDELGDLGPYAYKHGVSWTLLISLPHFHLALSIFAAIAIAEMNYSDRRGESWISTRTMIACAVAIPAWTLVIGLFVPYVPPLRWIAATIGLTVALIALALWIPARPFNLHTKRVPRPLVFGVLGAVNMIGFMVVTYMLPEWSGRPPLWGSIAILLGLELVSAVLLLVWSGGGLQWDDRHRLALIAGLLVFFIVFGVIADLESFGAHTLVSIGTVWALRRLWQHVSTVETVAVT